nr:dolichyl-diphosphooligosaccharide--protein glycosyltransferase subunit 1 [Onthophagus taurus]
MWTFLVVLAVLCGSSKSESINKNLVNKNIERIIDLSSQLVKITSTITLENTGTDPVLAFHVYTEPNTIGSLSFISARDSDKTELKLTKIKDGEDTYKVKLNSPLNAGRSTNVVIEYVYTNALTPYPVSITQKDRQLVRYFGSHYFYSPYKTTKQSTTLTLNSRAIESYTKLKPVSQSDSTINYGPYHNIESLTHDQMTVHFESNAPFLSVTRIERLIEISHWGNIAVQENIEILHSGAKLKGAFSRYDYQRDTSGSHHSIKSYHTALPAAAHSIYYRDSNGNISTSQVRIKKDWIELELRPRFPLFGGWKSSYTLGYSVPSYQYLMKSASGQYLLRMRLLDHVFDDMYVKELETSIVLPIGVQNIKLNLPYDVERLPDTVTHKYLDTMGRKVINIRKTNLVEQHIQDLEIIYNAPKIVI